MAARRLLIGTFSSVRGAAGSLGGRRAIDLASCLHQTTQDVHPPCEKDALPDILHCVRIYTTSVLYTVAGGKPKAKRTRFERNERLRANRRDPELERLARTRKREVTNARWL